jgi:ankyrin repeat protein
MTPLHEAVLLGSPELVNEWIPRSEKDEKNFLGQTPLHLATSNVKYLLPLINAGHDLDAADNFGITPLMYAAVANQEECLLALLDAGANPLLRDTRYNRDFLCYAAIRGHWNLILKTICRTEAVAPKETAEIWAQYATIMYYVYCPDYLGERKVSFKDLLAKCGSVNFTFGKEPQNNTLLHHARSGKDVEVLLELGFTPINHVNGAGQHPLMANALNQCSPDVVRRLLDAGAEVDLKDNLRHTTLYYVLRKLPSSCGGTISAAMDVARMLLVNGADVLCEDGCRCPCSPNGCLPSVALKYSISQDFFSASVPVWSLEWLNLLLEHRSPSDAKRNLLSFIRKAKFDEMGMTHVCCGRYTGWFSSEFLQKPPISDENIDEILDEESEFIKILENEMSLSTAKGYETLLDDWMLQIKASLETSCEEAIKYNIKCNSGDGLHQVLSPIVLFSRNIQLANVMLQDEYVVDYKNDRFIMNLNCYLPDKDPTIEVTSDIAEYIFWMEHEYHHGNAISKLDKAPRDDWYFRRMSCLRRLINTLEIPTAKIAERMRNKRMETPGSSFGDMDVEESIVHFLRSWEICEE